jgi:hypothetical protein
MSFQLARDEEFCLLPGSAECGQCNKSNQSCNLTLNILVILLTDNHVHLGLDPTLNKQNKGKNKFNNFFILDVKIEMSLLTIYVVIIFVKNQL